MDFYTKTHLLTSAAISFEYYINLAAKLFLHIYLYDPRFFNE